MKINKFVFIIIILILGLVLLSGKDIKNNKKSDLNNEKIKSINLATDYEIEQVLEDIKLVDANTVNVPVVINISDLESSEMKIDDYSKEKAIKLIKILKKNDIDVLLEAFPWIDNGSKYETEYNPKNKAKFFKNWKRVLGVLIRDVANPNDVEMMNVASNFVFLEEYEKQWCSIIKYVKSRFDGLVTYRTSWWYTANWDEDSKATYEKKLNNKIFYEVDFISIACYFELSEKKNNTVKELVDDINGTSIYNRNQNIKEEIKRVHEKYDKPIFFGELGFPRLDNASTQPWNMLVSDVSNDKEQARCFESYRIAFENEDYIKGFSVFAMGNKDSDKLFYPSKESIDVIYKWYK